MSGEMKCLGFRVAHMIVLGGKGHVSTGCENASGQNNARHFQFDWMQECTFLSFPFLLAPSEVSKCLLAVSRNEMSAHISASLLGKTFSL